MKIMHLHSSQSKRAAVKENPNNLNENQNVIANHETVKEKITTEVINQTVIVCAVRAFSNFLG